MTARSAVRLHTWARPAPSVRLVCLPFAGAGLVAYEALSRALPPSIEASAVQLPGREDRIGEACLRRVDDIVRPLAEAVAPLTTGPFALYGHSLGALLAFELVREFRRCGRPGPLHLFVSARQAPDAAGSLPPVHDLPDREVVDHLRLLGGTPDWILDDERLLGLLLPALRADFAVNETYSYTPEDPLDVPVTAIGGTGDPKVSRDELADWRRHTSARFRLRMLPGGHLFLVDQVSALVEVMSADLTAALAEGSRRS